MSVDASKWAKYVHREVAVGTTAKAVLRELADVASSDGRAWPLVSSIASVVEVDERTVIRALNKLVALGLIQHESWITPPNSAKRRPVYRLSMPEASPYCPDKALKKRGGMQPKATDQGCQSVTLGDVKSDEIVTCKGDRNDTPKGDTVSPKTKNSNCSEAIASSPGVRAPDGMAVEIIGGWPAEFQLLTGRREVVSALRAEMARGADPDAIAAGCAAYAGNRKAWGPSGVPMAPHNLIRSGRWETLAQAATAPKGSARARTVFACAEIRSAVLAARGEAWTASWLDPCGWDAEARRVAPGLRARAERLCEVAGIFETLGVAVEGLGHGR